MLDDLSRNEDESSPKLFGEVRFVGPLDDSYPPQDIVSDHGKQAVGVIGSELQARKVFEVVTVLFLSDEVFGISPLVVELDPFITPGPRS